MTIKLLSAAADKFMACLCLSKTDWSPCRKAADKINILIE